MHSGLLSIHGNWTDTWRPINFFSHITNTNVYILEIVITFYHNDESSQS